MAQVHFLNDQKHYHWFERKEYTSYYVYDDFYQYVSRTELRTWLQRNCVGEVLILLSHTAFESDHLYFELESDYAMFDMFVAARIPEES